jgi:peptidoglycan/LPS O-acetylase OafA/YrhL
MDIPKPDSEKKERFHFLDGLRGVAASLIVVHHGFSNNVFTALESLGLPLLGHFLYHFTESGVALFFVLSGIVLLRPYLRGERKMKIGDFYYRRLKRIYPPYLGALIFGAAVIWLVHYKPTWYSSILIAFSWEELLRETAIFNFDARYYNLAWWSLQIEVLFYLLVPAIIYVFSFAGKFSTKLLWQLLCGALVVSTALQFYWTFNYPHIYKYDIYQVTLYKFVDYPICFILGIYLAATDATTQTAKLFMAAGVLLVSLSWFYLPAHFPGFGFVYAACIIHIFRNAKIRSRLEHPLFVWLGERSYSLFLTHFSVMYLVNYLVSYVTPGRNIVYGIATRTLSVPASVFAAMLLFHFVERRFARGLVTADAFWPWQAAKKLEPHVKGSSIPSEMETHTGSRAEQVSKVQ